MSSSNSAVERVFSQLSTLLSDRRLSMSHATMEDCIVIAGNSNVWSAEEKDEILKSSVSKYMSKRRVKRLSSAPAAKAQPQSIAIESEDSEEDGSEDESDASSYSEEQPPTVAVETESEEDSSASGLDSDEELPAFITYETGDDESRS